MRYRLGRKGRSGLGHQGRPVAGRVVRLVGQRGLARFADWIATMGLVYLASCKYLRLCFLLLHIALLALRSWVPRC
jgi:hypothetical protein